MKRKIGFDLDATLIKMEVIELASAKLGYKFSSLDMYNWGFTDFPEDVRAEIHRLFNSPELCDKAVPTKGSQQKIRDLARNNHLVLITARDEVIRDATVVMMKKLFPSIKDINFVHPHESKVKIMLEKRLDIWVDDAPHGVTDSLNNGIKTYLVSNDHTKYNRNCIDPLKSSFSDLFNVILAVSEINF